MLPSTKILKLADTPATNHNGIVAPLRLGDNVLGNPRITILNLTLTDSGGMLAA